MTFTWAPTSTRGPSAYHTHTLTDTPAPSFSIPFYPRTPTSTRGHALHPWTSTSTRGHGQRPWTPTSTQSRGLTVHPQLRHPALGDRPFTPNHYQGTCPPLMDANQHQGTQCFTHGHHSTPGVITFSRISSDIRYSASYLPGIVMPI